MDTQPKTQTASQPTGARTFRPRSGGAGAGAGRPGGPRRFGDRKFAEREKPEFEHKVINVRRVARVVAGGRRFSFSVALVAGDKKGRVGVGIGKAGDTALAIEKAFNLAKKNMTKIILTEAHSIPHEVAAKFKSAQISIRPSAGRGLVAGSAVRVVMNMAGVKDVNAKITSRSKDKLNIARATMLALSKLKAKKVK